MKKLKIGIVGHLGVCGNAMKFGMTRLGHKVIGHDLRAGTDINDLKNTDICFIAVPTPKLPDNSCDISIVESVIKDLVNINYNAPIVIRSTVTPGTTNRFIKLYGQVGNRTISFSMETLRERQATGDFVENMRVLAVGTYEDSVYELVKLAHGHYPKNTIRLTPTECEFLKYYLNSINALRVSFALEMYDICKKTGLDYNDIKMGLLMATGLPDQYLDCNDEMVGWSSICWNKDIPALLKYANDLGIEPALLQTVWDTNEQRKKTPFAGTRENY